MRRLPAVHDHVGRAASCARQRHVGGRRHHQRGAEGEHQIGALGGAHGSTEQRDVQGLPEHHHCWLHQRAAGLAGGRLACALEVVHAALRRLAPLAVDALDLGVGPVQLDEFVATRTRGLVETVDVLRHQALELAAALELQERQMRGVGARVLERAMSLELVFPVLPPRGVVGHELLEVDRRALLPEAGRPTKIRDAAAGGDPRSGEDQHARRALDQRAQPFDCSRHHSASMRQTLPPKSAT